MKKNKMMRLAAVLLVCVLLSTSVIGGTFAKYVTTNGGADEARVAAFGVKIDIADDMGLFTTTYSSDETGTGAYNGDTVSIASGTTPNLVAPGTKGFMTFTITGTPEVATRVSIDFDSTCNAIQLEAKEHTLAAGFYEATAKSVTTTEVYEPIKFYFGTKAANTLTDNDYTMTLDQLKDKMTTDFTKDYDPNHNFAETNSGSYTLAWQWPFEGTVTVNGENVADFLDTVLANETTAQQEILKFDITVTQID